MKFKPTPRGFDRWRFIDYYGQDCSLQKSSLATDDAIWLGPDHPERSRMHLTRELVAELLPKLQHFLQTGDLPRPPKPAEPRRRLREFLRFWVKP